MSRCILPMLCKYASPLSVSLLTKAICGSVSAPVTVISITLTFILSVTAFKEREGIKSSFAIQLSFYCQPNVEYQSKVD